ncbi:MAG: LacI family DNA-binding transcriptional regulator [Oscillospiraceae bacterium]|nr:LacI family DNA-binding transcriptional regulator [Oscillospiraceae bacterium]
MAHRRITMQDIADACGLSRNTVSKIFNGRGAVPEATQQLVLQKAQELGYYQLPEPVAESAGPVRNSKNIALLTSRMPADYHFGTFFIPAFAERLSRAGYTLTMYEVPPEDILAERLPAHLPLEQTAGILSIELFDRGYLDMLCTLGLPVILVDAYANAHTTAMRCDLISMENVASTMEVAAHVIAAGAQRLGFVGDMRHCNSFYERWMGFSLALREADIPLERELCILSNDMEPYNDESWLLEQLRRMPDIPDGFICANDFLALHMMAALKRLGLAIPDDIMVAGFDGMPQSAVVEPSLTTVQIPNADIGRMAADILLERIKNPSRPFSSTYVRTTPVWRNSTTR